MFQYQLTNRYFGQIAGAMEELGAEELAQLDAHDIKTSYRGVFFNAEPAILYRINYTSRLFTRILAPLLTFQCHSTRYLYKTAKTINWAGLFSVDHTFAVFASVANSKIKHSKYAALVLKDAIADYFRDNYQKRPNIEKINPDVWINLHIDNDKAVISFDCSGGSLHRRGYRSEAVAAPIQETLAAAIIRLTEWDGSRPLYDPMCGSGTLLCEALMRYCQIPAGYLRKKFGFELLPDFDPHLWLDEKQAADQKIRQLPEGIIAGSDVSAGAIASATNNCSRLPGGGYINLGIKDFHDIKSLANQVIVCNPPYGIRLGDKMEIVQLYNAFGDFLKQKCQAASAFVYLGDRQLIPQIGLKPRWKKPLVNGALDGRLVKFEIY